MKLEPSLTTLQAQIELRVLLGSQAGSRLTLTAGQYDLGSGDDCAVILSGPKMEEMHARLNFDGERITISPMDGKISDAHGNEITEDYPLGFGAPIEIGGIWIAVDEIDAEWPDPADVVPIMPAPPVHAQTKDTPSVEDTANAQASLNNQQKYLLQNILNLKLNLIILIHFLYLYNLQPKVLYLHPILQIVHLIFVLVIDL